MNIFSFKQMRQDNKKIAVLTCYDYWSAKILSSTDIDCILVGDSLSMVMYGCKTTICATVDMMVNHTMAVAKGAPNKFIIGDMPFCSYRKGTVLGIEAVEKIMRAGANAVKLEGSIGNGEFIKHVVSSGVPVMGHIGLTPQSVYQLGGHKIQGKTKDEAKELIDQAIELQAVGCFSIVLECIPDNVAREITEKLEIPTIGIGAGADVSGQVLVLQDMLGMFEKTESKPKFVKKYMDGVSLIENAINEYITEVKKIKFPELKHSFKSKGNIESF